MKCPKEISICPGLWSDCDLCKYASLNNTCLHEPRSDIEIVILAAKIAEEAVTKDAVESAQKIRRTWAEHFKSLSSDEALKEFYRYKLPDINYKEPLKTGPSEPGGGSKSRNHKKPKKETPEYMKILGM